MRFLIFLAIIFSFFLKSFAGDNIKEIIPINYLVSYTLVKSHTKKEISALWKKNKIPKIMLPVHLGVDVYEIMYKAKWIDGTFRTESGIVYAPKIKIGKEVPTVMYGHGTEIHKGRKISDNDVQQGICMGFATDGYLALYPDYFGIGKGEGNHLYQHINKCIGFTFCMLI